MILENHFRARWLVAWPKRALRNAPNKKLTAPAGPAFGPIDTHERHQAHSEKRGSRFFWIIFYLGAGARP